MINRNACFALVIAVAGALALPAGAADSNPWVGTWTLDVAKSTFSPGPAPKSNVIVTTDAGGGKFHSDVTVVTADGKTLHTEATYAYDGTDYPVTGGTEGQTVALQKDPSTQTLTVTVKVNGNVTATITSVMASDGKSYTSTGTGTTPDGKPVKNVTVFNKS
jgi:hypothetical protein